MDGAVSNTAVDGFSGRRGFAQLHRDVWRVVRISPTIFVLLPAVLGFPLNMWAESVAAESPAGSWESLRAYIQTGQIAATFVNGFLVAAYMAALIEIAANRQPTLVGALGEGLRLWFPIIAVGCLGGVWILLGLVLLVVPGIVLMVRYALAVQVAVFEKLPPKEALKRSSEIVRRRPSAVVFGVAGAALLYLPLAIVPTILTPDAAEVWAKALSTVPINVLFAFLTIGLTLLYADLRGENGLAAPVGLTSAASDVGGPLESSTGKRGVVTALTASVASLGLAGLVIQILWIAPIDDGDAAWEDDAPQEALVHYQRAVYWDPANAYVHYSIAWCHLALGALPEALSALDTAIELEPEVPAYQLDRVRTLVWMDRIAEARSALRAARGLEGADPGVVAELQAEFPPPMSRAEFESLDLPRVGE